MILQAARLDIKPGQEAEFEKALAEARPLIEAQPGFSSLRVVRCVEAPSRYLFLAEWFILISIPTSKTSFAVTLLRLVTRTWQRVAIWFFIISMNIVLWLDGIMLFAQCTPVEKNWDSDLPGSCWSHLVQDYYSVFAGGKEICYSGVHSLLANVGF